MRCGETSTVATDEVKRRDGNAPSNHHVSVLSQYSRGRSRTPRRRPLDQPCVSPQAMEMPVTRRTYSRHSPEIVRSPTRLANAGMVFRLLDKRYYCSEGTTAQRAEQGAILQGHFILAVRRPGAARPAHSTFLIVGCEGAGAARPLTADEHEMALAIYGWWRTFSPGGCALDSGDSRVTEPERRCHGRSRK